MPKPESPEFGVAYDLEALAHEMRAEDAYRREGHAARTVVRAQDLRVVLIVMQPGARIPEHTASATAAIQVVAGHVRLRLPRLARQHEDRFEELAPGRLLVIDAGLSHTVEAIDEVTFVITLGWRDKAP